MHYAKSGFILRTRSPRMELLMSFSFMNRGTHRRTASPTKLERADDTGRIPLAIREDRCPGRSRKVAVAGLITVTEEGPSPNEVEDAAYDRGCRHCSCSCGLPSAARQGLRGPLVRGNFGGRG